MLPADGPRWMARSAAAVIWGASRLLSEQRHTSIRLRSKEAIVKASIPVYLPVVVGGGCSAKGRFWGGVGAGASDVFNALLQILEDGRLTDSQGRSVDFKNTVIIMTSNLGTADLRKTSVGFAKTSEAVTYEKMKLKVNDALKQHFRPEFLNRIDDVIVFHELTKDEVTEIIDLMIKRVRTSLESQGFDHRAHPGGQVLRGRRATTPPWAPARSGGPCSAWSRIPSPRRSSGRSSGPARPSSST